MKKFICASAIFLAANCHAADALDNTEIAKEAIFAGLNLIDFGQTRSIASGSHWSQSLKYKPGGVLYVDQQCAGICRREANPLLGDSPSNARIRNYFIGGIIGHALLTYALPRPYRSYWQNATLVFEGAIVARNAYLGIGMRF